MTLARKLSILLACCVVFLFSHAAWATDTDGDGLSDAFETAYGTLVNNVDSDGDGLSDFDEIFTYGTDPNMADTDGDGDDDGYEITHSTDPLDPGTDLDGVNACSLVSYPSSVGYAVSGESPVDGVGVMMHDGRLRYAAGVGTARGVKLPFGFDLYYDSSWSYDGFVGWNWAAPFLDASLSVNVSNDVTINLPPYGSQTWVWTGGGWDPPRGERRRVVYISGTTYQLATPQGFSWTFTGGQLASIQDRNGNATTLTYSGASCTGAIDSRGQTHSFHYWPSTGRLKDITMADGRVWTFRYSPKGDLMRIEGPATTSFPSGIWWEWRYTSGSTNNALNHNMIAAIDGRGNTWMKAQYDTSDRVVRQDVGNGNYSFDYSGALSQHTIVTDRNGNLRDWYWDSTKLTKTQLVEQTNRGVRYGEPDYTTNWVTDLDGYVTSITYPRGNGVKYTLNSVKLPTEVRRKADMTVADGSSDLVDAYTYDSAKYYGVAKHADPTGDITTSGMYTAYTLDGYGRPTTITFPVVTHPTTISAITNVYNYNADGTLDYFLDGEGKKTQYTYYSSGPRKGRVQTVTADYSSLNLATTYDYTDWGDVKSVIDPNANETDYTVEAYGNVTEEDAPASLGYVTTYEYDGNLNVTAKHVSNIDENGTPRSSPSTWDTTYSYTMMDKLEQLHEPTVGTGNRWTYMTYDPNDNLTGIIRGPSSKEIDFSYDERDLLYQRIRDPGYGHANATETLDYDDNRNITTYTNARGKTTTMEWDLYDRKTKVTNAIGNYQTLDYDHSSNVIETKDYDAAPSPNTVVADHKSDFDEMQRQWQEEDWLDQGGGSWLTRQMTRDGNGRVLTLTNRRGKVTTSTYDGTGRLSTVTDAVGNVTTYGYDPNGNVTSEVETDVIPGGGTADYETDWSYDAWNRQISKTILEAGGSGTKIDYWGYDSTNFVCKATDPLGYATTYAHDGLNRMTGKTEPLHGSTTATTTYAYDDSNDRLVMLTDDNGKKTKYDYDDLSYLIQTTHDYASPPNATTRVTQFVPDANGNVTEWTDPNGTVVDCVFDDVDRLSSRSATLGSGVGGDTSESFSYDALNRVTEAADNDSTVDFIYDSLSRVLTEAQTYGGNTKTTTYTTYDAEGNLRVLDYAGGFQANRHYDDIDRLDQIHDGSSAVVATFDLYGAGGRIKKTTFGNTTYTTYNYDGYRRPTAIDHKNSSNVRFAGYAYAWDANDNPLYEKRAHQGGNGDVYSYDKLNRLSKVLFAVADPVAEIASPGSQVYDHKLEYTMDGVFNITQTDSTPYAGSPTTTVTFPVDALNQYTPISPATTPNYDSNGNVTDDGTHTYVYDFHNHLIEAKIGGTTIGTYKYDAVGRGRRIVRTASATTRYVYSGDQAIEEYNGSNVLQRTYAFGDGVDQVAIMDDGTNRYYYHTQLIGSVTHITDGTQSIVESYEYDPYGTTTIKDSGGSPISASAIGNAYGYTGRQYDDETGLYYCRARYYAPNIRRFVERDPLGYADSPNANSYVTCRPTVSTDPDGCLQKKNQHFNFPDHDAMAATTHSENYTKDVTDTGWVKTDGDESSYEERTKTTIEQHDDVTDWVVYQTFETDDGTWHTYWEEDERDKQHVTTTTVETWWTTHTNGGYSSSVAAEKAAIAKDTPLAGAVQDIDTSLGIIGGTGKAIGFAAAKQAAAGGGGEAIAAGIYASGKVAKGALAIPLAIAHVAGAADWARAQVEALNYDRPPAPQTVDGARSGNGYSKDVKTVKDEPTEEFQWSSISVRDDGTPGCGLGGGDGHAPQ